MMQETGYGATDQAIIVQGTLVAQSVTPEVLAHPDTLVIFPLCWQACLLERVQVWCIV